MADFAEIQPGESASGIAVVGGGCSGLLVAVHLLKNHCRDVTVIEPRARLGQGLAYSTPFEQHLLNVPAGKMSAFPADPSHFLKWLHTRNVPGAAPEFFAPRKLYGDYLEDILEQQLRSHGGHGFRHIRSEVIDAEPTAAGIKLALSDRSTIEARKVVLALGNPASSPLDCLPASGDLAGWDISPWLGAALRVRFPGERILLVGTGLTAVDAAQALLPQQAGVIYMVSRRGVLPQVHDLGDLPGAPLMFEPADTLLGMFRKLRRHMESAGCWRCAVDALRPASNEIWVKLSVADRKRFFRHLKTYWEVHRHRMAPQVRCWMDEQIAQAKVQPIGGRIRRSYPDSGGFKVQVSIKRGPERVLEVDRIINCTGLHENYVESPRRLIRNLVGKGLAAANALGVGFRTDSSGALIGVNGPSRTLFTLGPPRRGELFETTAVPEIRMQAENLARFMIQSQSD